MDVATGVLVLMSEVMRGLGTRDKKRGTVRENSVLHPSAFTEAIAARTE